MTERVRAILLTATGTMLVINRIHPGKQCDHVVVAATDSPV
ncbi:hypothetical protein ACFFSH_31615 [Streptomyces filamentosus]|uniref:Uncharacterized protein n=1 Tax=Streptomyces filamentosus TaxID=67294 RepID=A0A919BU51_STRFL|nr:hypothetical protein [Streptomyces filamentosus]GHG13348.1 hypothetical protein GCM10017667_53960 [Streptomyces filamentosus]